MALWGLNDNIQTFGTVTVSGTTVTGTGTTFTSDVEVGQVIRIGVRGGVGTYYGDAVIGGITSDRVLTIDSNAGLSAASIAATSYGINECPCTLSRIVYTKKKETTQTPLYTVFQPILLVLMLLLTMDMLVL